MLLALVPTGCGNGLIYRHTIEPLTINFDSTPIAAGRPERGDVKNFRYSYVDIRWDENAIGRIAKTHGIETVYYADRETLSVLWFWTQNFVIVYGSTEKTE